MSATAPTEQTAEAGATQHGRGDRKQRFQKREGGYQSSYKREGGAPAGGEGIFKKDRQQFYKQQEEALAAAEKPPSFEEYSTTKQYQLQQELFNLVKTKVGTP